ncbi:ethanolamine ammonia-lyase subunit EutC [Brevibacillus daliensis]|uniref:ethanolamine ammonia-lyase subunit EutC n=1 Tax=Brevibacillus daliensis TaxID=2892995 RepID=UPI001E5A51D0|nr:ethanolamine ammonia-lyase subunit EutC [Brevibacillus daliensis]
MNEDKLIELVKQVVSEMTSTQKSDNPVMLEAVPSDSEEYVPDLSQVDFRKVLDIPHPANREEYLRVKAKTEARLGVWRTGPRYRTNTLLRFLSDHAAAMDAVFSDVSEEMLEEMGLFSVSSRCSSKDEHLTRPDLGRQFSEETIARFKAKLKPKAKVQIMVGDGLSSAAIEANLRDIIPAISQGLKMYGLEVGNIPFVKNCRVPAMDVIGDELEPEVVCMLIGERPGLVTAESMSAYIAYKPTVGMPEARRIVISNIHDGGTPAVEAGAHIAELIKTMLEKKTSGIVMGD